VSDYSGVDRRKHLTVRQVAELWGVSDDAIYAALKKGSLPGYRVGGCIRIRLLDALQFGVPMNGAPALTTEDGR
jgi:excisionase family DNA binding protein